MEGNFRRIERRHSTGRNAYAVYMRAPEQVEPPLGMNCPESPSVSAICIHRIDRSYHASTSGGAPASAIAPARFIIGPALVAAIALAVAKDVLAIKLRRVRPAFFMCI